MLTQVQPRDILTASELTKVRDFLCDADMLVTEVKSLFFNTVTPRRPPGSRTFTVASLMRFDPLSGYRCEHACVSPLTAA